MAAPVTVVAGQNQGFAPGSVNPNAGGLGGLVATAGPTANAVNNTLAPINNQPRVKNVGDAMLVPCSSCGANNDVKMIMGSRAQFTCGNCGTVVFWRPRQVWLRDQGRPMEKSIHPLPGESDGCCVLL